MAEVELNIEADIGLDAELDVQAEGDAQIEIEVAPEVDIQAEVELVGDKTEIQLGVDMNRPQPQQVDLNMTCTVNNDISTISYLNPEPIELELEGGNKGLDGANGYNLEVESKNVTTDLKVPLNADGKQSGQGICDCWNSPAFNAIAAVITWIAAAALLAIGIIFSLVFIYSVRSLDVDQTFSMRVVLWLIVFFCMASFMSAIIFTWKCCNAKIEAQQKVSMNLEYDVDAEIEIE